MKMWSPRAAEVVTNLVANLPVEQLDPARTHAARLHALPIGCDMWVDYYLRPNGEIVMVGADFNKPDEDEIVTTPIRVLSVLVWGSWRYPALRELLPQRGPDAIDCRCRVLRPDLFGPGKMICPECGGMGWLPASGEWK